MSFEPYLCCYSEVKIGSQQKKKMELTRENFRAMFYYDFWRGLSRLECIDQPISTFGDEAPSYATMKRWYNEFNRAPIRSPTNFVKVV